MRLNRKTILVIVLVTIPVVCIGVAFWGVAEFRAMGQTAEENWVKTDLSLYPEILSSWNNKAQIEHFPKQVPENATEIHLMYSPPFLQKGVNFQLRYKLPPSEIKRLHLQYSKIAEQEYEGHTGGTEEFMSKSYLPLPPFHINDDPEGSILPKDYVIIVLGAKPQGEEDFQWNHGYTYGVAINETKSEILYWVEDW